LSPSLSTGAPHPQFPVEFRGFPELPAPFLNERRTRGPFLELRTGNSGHLARFWRDVGYRRSLPQACCGPHKSVGVPHVRLSVRGPKTMGEARPKPSVPDSTPPDYNGLMHPMQHRAPGVSA
jgi:hypothetical protein